MKSQTLFDKSKGISNNLQFMKFLAAVAVIYAHAYGLTLKKGEFIAVLTDRRESLGGVAVSLFFLCGGFFIAKSMEKAKDAKKFIIARIKRLFPPLHFIILISIILGGIVTNYGLKDYYLNSKTWLYLLNGILIPVHDLPGVFINNPRFTTINGSLWTLPVEFFCYILCCISFKLRLSNKKKFVWTVFPVIIMAILDYCRVFACMGVLASTVRPMVLFYIGMFAWIYREKIHLNRIVFYLATLVFVVLMGFGLFNIAIYICFPYVMLYLWFAAPQVNTQIASLGNYSYGMYLCAFPIQQFLISLGSPFADIGVNIILSTIISGFGGAFIYYVIEQKLMSRFSKKKANDTT